MAKPICVIKADFDAITMQGGRPNVGEMTDNLQKKMPDYYVFVVPVDYAEEVLSFQVFHEKDFTEIQYAELKELIENSLKPEVLSE